jgi:hypothetical protein
VSRKWLVIVDGGILSAILRVFTRYSANDRQFPVNDWSLFTGKAHAIGGAWSAFVFRTAVNPSLEAPSENSFFARSGKQTSLHFWGAPLCLVPASAPRFATQGKDWTGRSWTFEVIRARIATRMWQRTESGRRVGVAPLTRRCRASIGTCEQPGQTEKPRPTKNPCPVNTVQGIAPR